MSTKPVTAETAAGIELASATERVTAAKVEALNFQVEGEAGYGRRYCHENECAGLTHWEGARVKSMRCGEGI
jgi:hypothetical protein